MAAHSEKDKTMSDRDEAGAAQDGNPTAPEPAGVLDITHRRNRMAGLWAAELLGLIGHAAQDYARNIMHPGHAQDEIHGDDQETVIGKLAKDLAGYVTLSEIREKMAQFLGEARGQKDSAPTPEREKAGREKPTDPV